MKLTPKQIEWINKERDTLITKCKVYDRIELGHMPPGWLNDRMRLQYIQLIIDLHNLETIKAKPKSN